MAPRSLGLFSLATKTPLRKFLREHERATRLYSAICCGNLQPKLQPHGRRWFSDPNIVKANYPEVKIPNMPFHELIFENIGQWETKVAVECGASGKKWTYRDLMKYSKGVAASLQKKFNLKKGDIQGIILPNCPEYAALYLAGSMTGVVSSTINPIYTPTEISNLVKYVKPKILFTTTDLYAKCVETLDLLNMKIPIVVVKLQPNAEVPSGSILFDELANTPGDYTPVSFDLEDDLVLPFSSGTTGLPKGVQLPHRSVGANLIQYSMGNELKSNPDKETNQSSILGVLPMFHIYGMVLVAFDGLREGARVVTLPRFEPKLFIETIYTKKTEIMYLVPPLIFFMANQPMVEKKHLERVQHVVTGAAPCGETDVMKLLSKAPHLVVSHGYGATETSPVITMTYIKRYHKISSTGHPLASTLVKVTDVNTGRSLPEGKRGEIRVKGPQVMKGYFERPEETRDAFDEDGWLKTGDIGYYDEEFDFYVVDRIKELIKVKGFQVPPAELEEFLRNHPKIADAGVIGVPHPEYGQAPKAFVVLKPGETVTPEEIQTYVKERLSSYKHLKGGVEFIKEIPRSSAGKILRRELKQMAS